LAFLRVFAALREKKEELLFFDFIVKNIQTLSNQHRTLKPARTKPRSRQGNLEKALCLTGIKGIRGMIVAKISPCCYRFWLFSAPLRLCARKRRAVVCSSFPESDNPCHPAMTFVVVFPLSHRDKSEKNRQHVGNHPITQGC
jgi:hypothetical protein